MRETVTMTLSDFLLARIAEDEESVEDSSGWYEHRWAIARTRLLAECEAKRQIVAEHDSYGHYGESCSICQESDIDLTPYPCPTLRHLATVYADHPDYREEWRP